MEVAVRAPKLIVALVIAALVATGCRDDGDGSTPNDEGSALSVYTPAELEDFVRPLVDAYETANEGESVEIVVNEQAAITGAITSGLADVAIVAEQWLEELGDEVDPQPLGRTVQVIGVAEGNPENVEGLDAFAADSGLSTRVCSNETSLGNLSLLALGAAGITPDPDTVDEGCEDEAMEQIAAGDLDAVLLFTGGVTVPEGTEFLDIDDDSTIFDFPIVYVAQEDTDAITSFTDFLDSPEAQDIVEEMGYGD
jgi:ABC-type molybdate transport system substrate-binding protein